MEGNIYLKREAGDLVELHEAPYASEDVLQSLIADYPNLLAGDQIDNEEPRRWLLVGRESGIPDHEDGGTRWSIDHVFLDQDSVPTFVEVKRSSDSRIRREVVGQMLDYAANATAYWTIETIGSALTAEYETRGEDPEAVVEHFVGDSTQVDTFWENAKTNLKAGKIRLVFVADVLPPELRRIIEFLNEQTDPMEVLGVEVRQYVGEGLTTLVPRVIGQTTEAQIRRSGKRQKRKWNEADWFEDLTTNVPEAVPVARRIYQWVCDRQLRIWWGEGMKVGTYIPIYDVAGEPNYTFNVFSNGRMEIPFGRMMGTGSFVSESDREELRQRLNRVEGIDVPEDGIDRWPSFRLSALEEANSVEHFLDVWDWYLNRVRELRDSDPDLS